MGISANTCRAIIDPTIDQLYIKPTKIWPIIGVTVQRRNKRNNNFGPFD